jgi:hypothetical protein
MAHTPSSERRYAILCDSVKAPGTVIARRAPGDAGRSNGSGFWTESDVERVGCFTREDAETVMAGLKFNNPRVVRFGKALKRIANQAAASAHGQLDTYGAACAVLAKHGLPQEELFA